STGVAYLPTRLLRPSGRRSTYKPAAPGGRTTSARGRRRRRDCVAPPRRGRRNLPAALPDLGKCSSDSAATGPEDFQETAGRVSTLLLCWRHGHLAAGGNACSCFATPGRPR